MATLRTFAVLSLVSLSLAGVGPTFGQAPAPSPAASALTFSVGELRDPLPEGAVTRLGSARLSHPGPISAVAFWPDGKVILTAATDGSLRSWMLPFGKPGLAVTAAPSHVSALAVSHDGRLIALGHADGHIDVRDHGGAQVVVRQLPHGSGSVTALAFIGKSTQVVIADRGGALTTCDAINGQPMTWTATGIGSAGALAVFGEGASAQVFWGDDDGRVIKSVPSTRVTTAWRVHPGAVTALTLAPDGTRIATGHGDAVVLTDALNGQEMRRLSWPRNPVTALAWAPDGRLVSVGSETGLVSQWDCATGKRQRGGGGHRGAVRRLAYSPTQAILASGGDDGVIHLRSAVRGQEVDRLDRHVDGISAVTFSPDGTVVAAGSLDGSISIWDPQSGIRRSRLTLPGLPCNAVHALVYHPGGKSILAGYENQDVLSWPEEGPPEEIRSFADEVRALALTPDGKTMAVGSATGRLKIFDLSRRPRAGGTLRYFPTERLELFRARAHPGGVCSAFWIAGDSRLATTGMDGQLRLWEAGRGWDGSSQAAHGPGACVAASRPGGEQLITAGADGAIRRWSSTGAPILPAIAEKGPPIRALAISPDGRYVATGGDDRSVHLWDLGAGSDPRPSRAPVVREVKVWSGHGGAIRTVAFSPDGKRVVSGSDDHTALIWEVSPTAP